jgi:hypothetical protein
MENNFSLSHWDANYGYSGYYVDRSDYNHYFPRASDAVMKMATIAAINMVASLMETIPCWITFCHKSSISRLFADDREDGALASAPSTRTCCRSARDFGKKGDTPNR